MLASKQRLDQGQRLTDTSGASVGDPIRRSALVAAQLARPVAGQVHLDPPHPGLGGALVSAQTSTP